MARSFQASLLLLLGILAATVAMGAERTEPPVCIVCSETVKPGTKYYVYEKHPVLRKEVFICATCNDLKLHCVKCSLPVKETAEKTEDGRYFCPVCYPVTAVKDDEIRQIFGDAAKEVINLTGGKMALKSPTITVTVFDVDYWNSKPGEKPAMQRHGLSTSRPVGNGYVHTVLLHRGLWKDEMAAVAAHEYTHLWINENKPENRTIEPQTIEAVCEVVGLALMEQRRLPEQVKAIMENAYTEGRINPVSQFYKVHGINRVLDWVREGQAAAFDERDFQVATTSGVSVIWPAAGPAYRQEFTELKLKGIIGGKSGSVALINDKTFSTGEERKMEIAGKRLLIKLLEIGDDAVTVQVEGKTDPVKLRRE